MPLFTPGIATPVTVANGGTGLTTLTANNVVLGNGSGTTLFVAPGSNGNVLTSNGTIWTSAAAGGGTIVNARYNSSTTSISGLTLISYNTKDFDSGTAYLSGTYTIPTSGHYQVTAGIYMGGSFVLNNAVTCNINKNGTITASGIVFAAAAVSNIQVIVTDLIAFSANDTMTITASNNGGSPSIAASTTRNYFTIYYVSA